MAKLKKPIQIYLEERQERVLRLLAKEKKISMAALLRQGADRVIEEMLPPDKDPLFDLPMIAESGGPKYGADKHDEYLNKQTKERKR